jgi:hypothetical protein
MKLRQEFKVDLLNQYLNPEGIEKAPDGFTDKLMLQISTEPVRVSTAILKRKKSAVPIVSVLLTTSFILIALVVPVNDTVPSAFRWLNNFDRINITLPDFELIGIFNISLPETLFYIMPGILLLLIFDRALSRYFH